MTTPSAAGLITFGVCSLLCAPAVAQLNPARVLPRLATSSKQALKPGIWVKYTLYLKQSRRVLRVRMAALERERGGQWFEIALTDPSRRTMVFKSLVEGTLAKPKRILRCIVQPPGQKALLLPESMAQKQLPAFSAGPGPAARLVGQQQVKVAAGTFKARKYRREHKGVVTWAWFSAKVPGWPMVKVESPQLIMELVSHGTSARTQIKGKPAKLDQRMLKRLGLE